MPFRPPPPCGDREMFIGVRVVGGLDSKSTFRGLPEVEIQQKIHLWKAESLSFLSVEESASEDITIESYGDFEILQNLQNL